MSILQYVDRVAGHKNANRQVLHPKAQLSFAIRARLGLAGSMVSIFEQVVVGSLRSRLPEQTMWRNSDSRDILSIVEIEHTPVFEEH